MGNCNLNCCDNLPKAPNPYTFQFTAQDKIPQNVTNFESNKVRTSKYTFLSFFPLALISQFMRLANVYFLIIAILQTVPQISPLSVYTAWIPLIVVLAISMFREAIEDVSRCRQDTKTNFDSKAMVRRSGQWIEVSWSQVVVGEICIIEQDQYFPADLILLASAIPGGNAFIQTASLDGQKNLKPRMAPQQFAQFRENNNIDKFSGECIASSPDRSLSNFSATINLKGAQQKVILEGQKQLLYRGAKLKNTKWIYGLVVYTGRNTKIMLNSQNHRNKMSQIEVKVNKLLIIIFLFQVVLCIVCAVCYGVQANRQISRGYWYLHQERSVAAQSVLIFFSYLVLFNTMIPISLIVSLEIVKAVQAMFIQNDVLMFSKLRNRGCKVFSASLNEQLGQVEYVFTDKTGTLTLNIMQFKIAVIGETLYGDTSLISDSPNAQPPPQKLPEGVKGFYDEKLIMLLSGAGQSKQIKPIQILNSQNQPGQTINNERQLAQQYMTALSVAHEVVQDKDKEGNSTYQGPSPDEITLVQAAKNSGYTFLRTDNQYSYVKVGGKDERFELLSVNPFTSDRKRMSVIVRVNGKIKLFIKGADSIIKKRLAPNQVYLTSIDKYLHTFAVKGLRTLLIAQKILTDQQYSRYKQAEQNLPEKDRQKHRQKIVSELENGLTLIGATAVLDRLQDNVPETIRDLIQANIKVWMLTGDKLQTAENIAISCNLIQPHFQVMRFLPKTDNLQAQIKKMAATAQGYTASGVKKAFLIEGEHLGVLFESQTCKMIIADMAQHCEAVVCCRLLPMQKAEVVKLVKDRLNKITLAIGDGANDVPMITTAHIGVGLYGEEGMGSVSASDYALPEFQCLWRLLLIHGRWNYLRISQMILYFFYKNMMFTIPQFYFAFFCSYSAQTLFDDGYVSLFNLVFTSIPLIIKAVLEQDIYYIYNTYHNQFSQNPLSLLPNGYEQKNSLKLLFPNIYYLGQQNKIFHYRSFLWWTFEGILTGLLITLLSVYTLSETSLNSSGINVDLWSVSITIYSAVILAVTFKLATHTRFWSVITFVGTIVLSLGLYIAYMWISNVNSTNVQGSIMPIYRSFNTWLLVFYVIGILLVFDGIFVYYRFICGGDTSRMRTVVDNDRISDMFYYQEIALKPGVAKQKEVTGTLDVLYH